MLAIAGLAFGQQADNVHARAWTDSTHYLVGDAIVLHVAVSHPAGTTLHIPADSVLGKLVVLQRLTPTNGGDTSTTTGYVVAYYDSGDVQIPPVALSYSLANDTTRREVLTSPITLTVRTVAVDTTKEYRDLKQPMSIPLSAAEIALALAIVLVVAVLVFLGYRYWKKRKEMPKEGKAAAVSAKPADVIALEELAAVKARQLWQNGMVKQYYTEVTEVIRRYFERRYAVRALEETTDEILTALHGVRASEEGIASADRMLRLADLVKFAKFQPAPSDHEEVLALAYSVVALTKPVPVPAATDAPALRGSGKQQGANAGDAHVGF